MYILPRLVRAPKLSENYLGEVRHRIHPPLVQTVRRIVVAKVRPVNHFAHPPQILRTEYLNLS